MTHSGCRLNRSESGLTISGSNHSPNCMPSECTSPISSSRPSGHTSRSIHQSPSPEESVRRRWNHPSSRTYRSTPMDAALRAMSARTSRFWSMYTASHTLSVTGCLEGWEGSVRSQWWNPCMIGSSPWEEAATTTHGVEYDSPSASWISPGSSSSPAYAMGPSSPPRHTASSVLPLQAGCRHSTEPVLKLNPGVPA